MNFAEWLKLQEMPIKAMNFLPPENWPEINGGKKRQGFGYNAQDRGILGNESAKAKIISKWNNTHTDFILYFVRSKEAVKHREVGEVSQEWVKTNLGVDIAPEEDTVKIIFTNNIGAEKIPMTAWMIAHRMGHAIAQTHGWKEFTKEFDKQISYLMKDVYGKEIKYNYGFPDQESERSLKHLANNIGTMKSARSGSIFRFNEFKFELLAQFITTGKVEFNDLKKVLAKGNAFGNFSISSRLSPEEMEDQNEILRGLASTCQYYLSWAVDAVQNKLFVM